MKHFSVIHILLFLLLLLFFQLAGAQDYVLTTRGDSLAGDVRPLLYGPEKKVQVVTSDDKKTTLSIFQVREFSSKGDRYQPVKGESGYVFMKLIQPGYLSLYAFQQDNQARYDGMFLKKLDGETLVVPNLGFKKFVSQFLEDCPEVSQRVKDGDLNKKNLRQLIDAYNACIDGRTIDHKSILAQREVQTTKLSAWESLEEKVKEANFAEKNDALEMIAEIRKKIQQQEKIPNFLLEGLKNSLRDSGLTSELEEAMREINN